MKGPERIKCSSPDLTSRGSAAVAGQSHDTATAYSTDALAWRARPDDHSQPLPVPPTWLDRLQQLDSARVVLAHDHAVWEPKTRPGQ